jgi:hypothetical protein
MHLDVFASNALWSCEAGNEANDWQTVSDLLHDFLKVIREASAALTRSTKSDFDLLRLENNISGHIRKSARDSLFGVTTTKDGTWNKRSQGWP